MRDPPPPPTPRHAACMGGQLQHRDATAALTPPLPGRSNVPLAAMWVAGALLADQLDLRASKTTDESESENSSEPVQRFPETENGRRLISSDELQPQVPRGGSDSDKGAQVQARLPSPLPKKILHHRKNDPPKRGGGGEGVA